MSKKLVKFRVHPAFFLDKNGEIPKNAKRHLFLNVRNDSDTPIVIEKVKHLIKHDWRLIRNVQRPVPAQLLPGHEWETWVPETNQNKDKYYRFLLVYKPGGTTKTNPLLNKSLQLIATKRYNVPAKGNVPNGY